MTAIGMDGPEQRPGHRFRWREGVAGAIQTASVAALIALALVGTAQAQQGHFLHGLFCNTEGQIDETLAHMRQDLAPQAAVDLTNEATVVCVFADKVQYMIVGPLVLDEILGGVLLTKYQGTLVGILVGDNIRPVDPPVRIFFVSTERLAGAPAPEDV